MREEAGYPLHGTKSRLNYCAAQSPLGGQVAHSQPDGNFPGDHYGYNFRLLYGQGPAAAAGAHDCIVDGHMIGFGAIAWPARYCETGIIIFIMVMRHCP